MSDDFKPRKSSSSKEDIKIIENGGYEALKFINENPATLLLQLYNDRNETLLNVAVKTGNINLLRSMCETVQKKRGKKVLSLFLPLTTCVTAQQPEMLEMLIMDFGAESQINVPYSCNNEYLLHLSARYDERHEVLQVLLKHNCDTEVYNDSGDTPLCFAIYCGAKQNVKALIDAGANSLSNKREYSIQVGLPRIHGTMIYTTQEIVDMINT